MKRFLPLLSLFLMSGCVMPPQYNRRPAPPAPCLKPVGPIRYETLYVVINVNYSYTPKDGEKGRTLLQQGVLDELNTMGRPDGNSFSQPNGQPTNFTFTYSISNDGQDHYTGSLQFSGWGEGSIHQFARYQYPYASPSLLVKDLTDDAYSFIHNGWHDLRPNCPQ